MPSKKVYDLAVKVGSYRDREGNEKARWKTIGSEWENEDGGRFLVLDSTIVAMEVQWVANPEHKERIMVSKFDSNRGQGQGQQRGQNSAQAAQSQQGAPAPQAASQTPPAQRQGKSGFDDMDDDIPF